jgi:hypothetical protein
MLIFDRFNSIQDATAFAIHVRDNFARSTRVCASQKESNQYDPFPFVLYPPIVLVDRDDSRGLIEDEIESIVDQFSGEFAGT